MAFELKGHLSRFRQDAVQTFVRLSQQFERKKWCVHHREDHELVPAGPGSPLCLACEQDYQLFGHFELYKYPEAVARVIRPEILEGLEQGENGIFVQGMKQLKANSSLNEVIPFPERIKKAATNATKIVRKKVNNAARLLSTR